MRRLKFGLKQLKFGLQLLKFDGPGLMRHEIFRKSLPGRLLA
jgi:hypothetical protein